MSRRVRPLTQAGFLVLTVAGVFLVGGNAERWCPFGGVESLWPAFTGGGLPCSLAWSNVFLLGGLLLSALLVRRAFCGYACPVGAVSEWTRSLGRRLRLPRLPVPARLDAVLSLLKVPALAAILFLTWRTGELIFRGFDPCYALISKHGEDITAWAYGVSGAILALSLFTTVPFCRWLCPLAVVLNPFSKASPARVTRGESCLDCGKCARACPMAIPVDRVATVRHARCTACLDCVDACPEQAGGALGLTMPGGRRWSRSGVAAALVLVLAGSVAAATWWPIPSFSWERGALPADAATVDLELAGLTCRGRANLLVWFLDRDDDLAVPGPLRLEAWPGPDAARARLAYDPARTDGDAIRAAVTEPCFEAGARRWRASEFTIPGWDPLGLPQ